MKKIIFCSILICSCNVHVPCFSQIESDEIRLTYYTGKDDVSQRMNKVFYDTDAIDNLRHVVKILCIDMQSGDIDTIPTNLKMLNSVEQIEIEWKSEQTKLYGFQMFPKLTRLSLFSSKLKLEQIDTVWLKQIEILEIRKHSELNGLDSFSWIPNLNQLYVESAKICNPLPEGINSLTKLKILRCGPLCSLIKDLGNIDLEILSNLEEIDIETSTCDIIGIPSNILLSEELKSIRIKHPNLTLKEKKILCKSEKNIK